MDIGRAIQEIRKEKGLKLEAVALDAGTDTGYLSRIENGNRRPSLEMLEKLAIALGTTATNIVKRAEELNGQEPPADGDTTRHAHQAARNFQRVFNALSSENQKIAIEMLKVLYRSEKHE